VSCQKRKNVIKKEQKVISPTKETFEERILAYRGATFEE
jgi:hypothetical protein